MNKSFFTAPVVIGQLAVVALFVQGCTTYTPGRTALGTPSKEIPHGTVIRTDGGASGASVTTVTPKSVPSTQTPDVPYTTFVIPEGKSERDPREGLTKTATRHVPTPAPSTGVETPTVTTSSDGKYASYTVKRGDTAGEIANRHGLTRAEFSRINSLANPDRILVGQQLKVPAGGKPLAAKTATSVATTEAGVHVVASGESLSEIAVKYSMRTADLAALNGISNPNMIRVGQKLKVSKAAASTKPRTAVKTAAPTEATATKPAQARPEAEPTAEPSFDLDVSEDPIEALLGTASMAPVVPTVQASSVSTSAPASTKPAALREHVVNEGEDIYSIAFEYRVRPMDIRRENNMSGSVVTPGSVIKIPASDPSN